MSNIAYCCKHLSYQQGQYCMLLCLQSEWKSDHGKETAVQNKKIRKKQEQENKTLMRSCWPPISNLSSVWLEMFSWWCLKMLTTEKLQYLH